MKNIKIRNNKRRKRKTKEEVRVGIRKKLRNITIRVRAKREISKTERD